MTITQIGSLWSIADILYAVTSLQVDDSYDRIEVTEVARAPHVNVGIQSQIDALPASLGEYKRVLFDLCSMTVETKWFENRAKSGELKRVAVGVEEWLRGQV
jgi:hypothetical protein